VRGQPRFSRARLLGVKRLAWKSPTDGIYNAALAGQFGVPVAFVSVDRIAVTQLSDGRDDGRAPSRKIRSAITRVNGPPARGHAMIRDGVTRAMAKLSSMQPYRIDAVSSKSVQSHIYSERAAFIPGLVRVSTH